MIRLQFLWAILWMVFPASLIGQDSSNQSPWKRTGSPETYIHQIELRDSRGQVISPDDPSGLQPDMAATCAPCHDVQSASGGLHGGQGTDGPNGEPWFLIDSRSGSRWPFHSRSWPGFLSTKDLGLTQDDLRKSHGSFDPGGSHSISGQNSDCLICHLSGEYQFEKRDRLIRQGKTELAPFVAAGLIDSSGKMPSHRYDTSAKVTLNLKADAGPSACLHCHSVKPAGFAESRPNWTHAEDVHLAAGMSCVDCHRSGIDHHIVRGKDGESHPSGVSVESLSCRGCHLPAGEVVMHSAPRPEHRGLPPFHIESMTCTACHSGSHPDQQGHKIWTSRAHQLGIAKQGRSSTDAPAIYSDIIAKDDQNRWAPHYQAWPEGWIRIADGDQPATAIPPSDLRTPLRRILRVRSHLLEKISSTTESPDKAERSLSAFLGQLDPPAALVTAGQAWEKAPGDLLKPIDPTLDQALAKPVDWKIGHPVRPAAMSLGINGCSDCHSTESAWPMLNSHPNPFIPITSANAGVHTKNNPDNDHPTFDSNLWNFWKVLFSGRDLAKFYFGGCAFLALLASLNMLFRSWDRSGS
ncbi:hypothetical protein CBD41_07355 [bacterium TMED181]|nr:hypothetical protein [Planctomycetota bacterium]OUW43340.1 MAG: hypothetical protein CBD41_07355 [bacterium TMED181]